MVYLDTRSGTNLKKEAKAMDKGMTGILVMFVVVILAVLTANWVSKQLPAA